MKEVMNIKKSLEELEKYFSEEGNQPEVINHKTKRAAVIIASTCAHPHDLEAEDLEEIGLALQHLSDIVDIVDRYEDDEA